MITGLHVAFQAADRAAVDAFHAAALAAGARDNGGAGDAAPVPRALLRRLRPGPGRQQRRSRLPHAGMISRAASSASARPDDRLPPGQYLERGFPVLSGGSDAAHAAGAVDVRDPRRDLRGALLELGGVQGPAARAAARGHPLRHHLVQARHDWGGVSVDTLLDGVELQGGYVTAFCDGGYTTNLPVEDITGGKAWVVDEFDGYDLEPQHGGPARLLVPHLYFWKSAKWVRGLLFTEEDDPGFWETLGYHDRGDPWLEQRYQGD